MDSPIVHSRPLRLTKASAWKTHVPFAFWLIQAVRPRCLVELGTHTGVSYAAFCQAIRDLGLACRAYAVDTWQGDEHAGFYGQEIYDDLDAFNKAEFASFSTLLRMTFDEAREQFADGSVDLLHIDGFHSYEAVKHDFETWKDKLSPNAVVLFHDTYEFAEGFGVYCFFQEIAREYPHFEFHHGHGLGVMSLSRQVNGPLASLLRPPGWRKGMFGRFRMKREKRVRSHFSRLGTDLRV